MYYDFIRLQYLMDKLTIDQLYSLTPRYITMDQAQQIVLDKTTMEEEKNNEPEVDEVPVYGLL